LFFVICAYAAHKVNAAPLWLRLNLLAVAVHAEDMGAVGNVSRPEFASAAMSVGGGVGEKAHRYTSLCQAQTAVHNHCVSL